jgi:hypothetical protein
MPMAGVKEIRVETSFGPLTFGGAETNDCNITARITGQALRANTAEQLAEQTRIKLEMVGETLVVRAEKPKIKLTQSVAVGYDIIVPTRTNIAGKSSHGQIDLANIRGNVIARTSFGGLRADNITGKVQLETSYGKIDCNQIASPFFSARSSFGNIEVVFSEACPNDLSARMTTSYGDIEADIASNFAGKIAVETSFGKLKTEVPISVKGEISKKKFIGRVGRPVHAEPGQAVESGNGWIEIKTSFGSVTIR